MPKDGEIQTGDKTGAKTGGGSAGRARSDSVPGRLAAAERSDGGDSPSSGGPAKYTKPSLFGDGGLFGDESVEGKVEGVRDPGVARLTLENPTWDPNAVVHVNGKDEKGGWVDASPARDAKGTKSQIDPATLVDKRMVSGTDLDASKANPKLETGTLTEDDLNALTPAQVAQVNPLGTAPRAILKNAMHESWHHAKEKLLAPGGNAPARQMLMAKLWEFRQWHHNMILQRTQNDAAIGKDGLSEWKAAGSTTLTSDIDVNLKGNKTELAVAKFNDLFKKDGFSHEAGVVYDVNVYAVDFMHKDTFKGLAEQAGQVKRHDFDQVDPATKAKKPDPETRVSAKEGAREGSEGGGVGTQNPMLEQRMIQADADLQRVWSLVKMRLYMTGEEWNQYVKSTKLPDATLSAVMLRYNSYMNDLSARMADGSKLTVAADAMKVTGFKMLDATASAKASQSAHADAENVKMAASNRIYEEKLIEMGRVRAKVTSQIELRKTWLSRGDHGDAEALDAAIDGNLAILRDLISECAMFSNEAYVTDGAVNHVVVGLQSKIGIKQTNSESLDAFNENVADSLKEIARHDRTLGEAAYKAGKYLWRMADAAQNLRVSNTAEDTTLTTHITALYAAGNTVANKIKGGDDSQAELETKAAAALTGPLGTYGVSDCDSLKAFVRSLAARVANASSETVRSSGQARSSTVKISH